jgi:hypothetical protein
MSQSEEPLIKNFMENYADFKSKIGAINAKLQESLAN